MPEYLAAGAPGGRPRRPDPAQRVPRGPAAAGRAGDRGQRAQGRGARAARRQAGAPPERRQGEGLQEPAGHQGGQGRAGEAAVSRASRSHLVLADRQATGDPACRAEHMLPPGSRVPDHLPVVARSPRAVYRIVGARSVYQTAQDNLCPDGRVHPKIGFEQATGRWSVTKPGLTVFGKRGGRHVERDVFLPDPGEVLISVRPQPGRHARRGRAEPGSRRTSRC